MSLKVLISYHSYSEEFVSKLNSHLKRNGFDTFLMSENQPEMLTVRSFAIKETNVILVIASRPYQRSIPCMEVINYAKDKEKQFNAINPYTTYKPFGALGAIIASREGCLINIDTPDALDEAFARLDASLNARPKSSRKFADIMNAKEASEYNIDLVQDTKTTDVLVTYHNDVESTASIVINELKSANINYLVEDASIEKSNIYNAKLLVVIMSKGYEESKYFQKVFEVARHLKKQIIPISATKSWKPENWLGLAVAGKLFFRFLSQEQATQSYKNIPDSSPIKDFINAVKKALSPKPSEEEIENAQIKALETQIGECKKKLTSWPPKRKPAVNRTECKPVKVELVEPKATAEINHTHYTVMRVDFPVPKPLYDDFGVPLRIKFDCMISYEWKNQQLVRDVYMDLHMQRLNIWFDVHGGMEVSTTDSMATAIENSKVIVVFLSNKYQESTNCQLEFRYAASRGKPFLFILVEENLKIEPWIEPYFNDSYKYEIFKIDDEGILHNGVPRINVIAHAIRTIGSAQPDENSYDLSESVFELRQLLNDALDEISNQTGVARHKICTRCRKEYDDLTVSGCKKHIGYYLDFGGLMGSYWVCCNQEAKDAIGCANANHMDQPRQWVTNPTYGHETWEPP